MITNKYHSDFLTWSEQIQTNFFSNTNKTYRNEIKSTKYTFIKSEMNFCAQLFNFKKQTQDRI